MSRNLTTALMSFALIIISLFNYPLAKAEPVTVIAAAVAQEAVMKGVEFALGEIYDSSCSTPSNPRNLNGLEAFVCNSSASMSGRDEEEYKNEMREGMAAIKKVVDRIEQDLSGLRNGQKQIKIALSRIETKVEAIPLETVAQQAVSDMRVLWHDRFLPMANGTVSRTPAQILDLAGDIVLEQRVNHKLGILAVAMTEQGLGNSLPLLTQQMNVILLGLKHATLDDLELPHRYFQSVMSSYLMDYGRGEMMYAWAVRMLEAECAVLQEQGESCRTLQASSQDMRNLSLRHRTEMLDLYRNNVERLVLAYSSPSSLNRNFLHEDAIDVLVATDFFLALHLPNRRGIRGRVIAAGDSFSGTLSINKKSVTAEPARMIASTSDIDWWTRPSTSRPYDKVHFAPAWSIYDVVFDPFGHDMLEIDSPLPWHSGTFKLQEFDALNGEIATEQTPEDRIIAFGTFTVIARAGGAYAMMLNAWRGLFEGEDSNNLGTRTQPAVIASTSGTVIYNPHDITKGTAGKRDFDTNWIVRRRSEITLVDGGKITIHGKFRDAEAIRADRSNKQRSLSIPIDTAIYHDINFRPSTVSARSKIFLRTGVMFAREHGENGLTSVVDENNIIKRSTGTIPHNGYASVTVSYPAGTRLSARLLAEYRGTIYSTGWDPTSYTLFAGVAPTALYFTRE